MADKLTSHKIKPCTTLIGTYHEGDGVKSFQAVRDGYVTIKAPLAAPERSLQGIATNNILNVGTVITCKINAYSGALVTSIPVNAGDTVVVDNVSGVTSVGLEIYN